MATRPKSQQLEIIFKLSFFFFNWLLEVVLFSEVFRFRKFSRNLFGNQSHARTGFVYYTHFCIFASLCNVSKLEVPFATVTLNCSLRKICSQTYSFANLFGYFFFQWLLISKTVKKVCEDLWINSILISYEFIFIFGQGDSLWSCHLVTYCWLTISVLV